MIDIQTLVVSTLLCFQLVWNYSHKQSCTEITTKYLRHPYSIVTKVYGEDSKFCNEAGTKCETLQNDLNAEALGKTQTIFSFTIIKNPNS